MSKVWIRDESEKTKVSDFVAATVAKLGEIAVRRFARFAVGERAPADAGAKARRRRALDGVGKGVDLRRTEG